MRPRRDALGERFALTRGVSRTLPTLASLLGAGLLCATLLTSGCVPRDKTGFDAFGPSHRLDAIVLAADRTDDDSLRGLIQALDYDDPAARLLAIRALEKRTGQTLDYRYDAPVWERSKGVARWTDWYHSRPAPVGAAASRPEGS